MINDNERSRKLLRHHIEVIQQYFKGRNAGISPDKIKSNCLYVVDWCLSRKDRLDGIKVEYVVGIEEDGTLDLDGSFTDREGFARLVLAGPFSLE